MKVDTILYKMHKPFGVISQMLSNNAKEQRSKVFLSDLQNVPDKLMAIGRLDEKSEGLLLLTNDGVLSNTVNRSGIEKEYYVQLDGAITDKAIEALELGVSIGLHGKIYKTKPCKAKRLKHEPNFAPPSPKIRIGRHNRPNSWVSICITEGKFRQVRKMTSVVGFPTLRLVRVRIGNITLDDMMAEDVLQIENTFV